MKRMTLILSLITGFFLFFPGTQTIKILAVQGECDLKIKVQAIIMGQKLYLKDKDLVSRKRSLMAEVESILNDDLEETEEENFYDIYADTNDECDSEDLCLELEDEDYDVEIIEQILLALEVEYGLEKETILDLLDYLYELDEIYEFNSEEEILIILVEEELELMSYFNEDELREIISALVVLDNLDVISYL